MDQEQSLHLIHLHLPHCLSQGRSGGAMVLGKLSVPAHPTNLYYCRARAYCACLGAGGHCLDIFLSSILFPFSRCVGEGPI